MDWVPQQENIFNKSVEFTQVLIRRTGKTLNKIGVRYLLVTIRPRRRCQRS